MNQSKLAEARRLYHHVCNGGTLTPEDVSFMVVALEEAYEQVEVDRLRAKKKQIYEDLKSEQTHNTKGELTYDPEGEEHMKSGTINVTDYVEHEDGSATLVVDTDKDATRLLVEVGLRRLLEMAVQNEEGYEFKDEAEEVVPEATESSVQEEVG